MENTDQKSLHDEILEETLLLFNESGLKFTMDDLAKNMHRSKKTIYTIFPDKKKLLDEMVDYMFDHIQSSKKQLADEEMDIVDKIRMVLGAMPEQYSNIDLQQLYILKEKYPKIYAHLQERLENEWEIPIALLNEGMKQGRIRPVSIPVFKTMMQATLEQFFARDVLVENGITYGKALQEVVDILIRGIEVNGER